VKRHSPEEANGIKKRLTLWKMTDDRREINYMKLEFGIDNQFCQFKFHFPILLKTGHRHSWKCKLPIHIYCSLIYKYFIAQNVS
jgi:hypothetical protein